MVVGLALTIVIAMWLERAGSAGETSDSMFGTYEIRITGPGNTLASVARKVPDSKWFSYDSTRRTAVSYATLVIEGELQLGNEGDPNDAECLEMATSICGDLRIEVRPGGVLRLYHSTIRTVSQVLSNTACSQGYALFVDGKLIMDHSRISYISGSTSQCLRRGAEAIIKHSTFSQCDGSALNCINVDGSRVIIDDCEIIGSGNWGLVIQGSGDAPLQLRNSVLDGQIGAVFLTGESAGVHLVDCTLDPTKIVFNGPSGKATVTWTRCFKVVDKTTGKPMADVKVRAKSANGSGESHIAEGRTNTEGVAELELTGWVARPSQAKRMEGINTAGPYQVSVLGKDDNLLAKITDLVVRGKENEPIVIESKQD